MCADTNFYTNQIAANYGADMWNNSAQSMLISSPGLYLIIGHYHTGNRGLATRVLTGSGLALIGTYTSETNSGSCSLFAVRISVSAHTTVVRCRFQRSLPLICTL